MQSKFKITTAKKNEMLDITEDIQDVISKSKIEDVTILIYAQHNR